jgi:hypothetical protein
LLVAASFIGVIAIIVFWVRQTARDRAAKLAAMSEKERQAYVAQTHRDFQAARRVAEDERANRENKKDEGKAKDAIRLIEVAVAEGRRSARVWVPQKDVEAVRRWGARNGYTVLVAKERGSQGDAQLSITWASRRT